MDSVNYVVMVPEGQGVDLMFGGHVEFFYFTDFDEAVDFGKQFDGSRMAPLKMAIRDDEGNWVK